MLPLFALIAIAAGPANAQIARNLDAQQSQSAATITIRNDIPVLSSDGVQVAKTAHIPNNERSYAPDEMFFTADRYYNLRRIYAREVSSTGGSVRLKMTAAQFRARHQNPD